MCGHGLIAPAKGAGARSDGTARVETVLNAAFATPTPVIAAWVVSIAGLPVSIAALSVRVAGVSAALATPSMPIAGRSAGVETR